MKKRKFEHAITLYNEILEMDQSNVKLSSKMLVQIGRASYMKGDLQHAIIACTKSLNRYTNNDALWLRSKIHFKKGSYQNAIADLEVAFNVAADEKKQKIEDALNKYKIQIKKKDVDCYCRIILGIEDNADLKDIKSIYRNLAKLNHPDKLQEKPTKEKLKREEFMKELNFAKLYFEKKHRNL